MGLREDGEHIVRTAIEQVKPDSAVKRALEQVELSGRIYVIAVGKAGWQMAKACLQYLEQPITAGIVITKYHHVEGDLPGFICFEAGHPVVDEQSLAAAKAARAMVSDLHAEDTVLFLLSGGGSALFEEPLIPLEEIQDITEQLLRSGADIVEMNTIRKRLSGVKGGKFAASCYPARVENIILSDILGDPLDMIASGPTVVDLSTQEQAEDVLRKYKLQLSPEALDCLKQDTPKELPHVHTQVIGSVRELCKAAELECGQLGYEVCFLTDQLACEAREAGLFLAGILQTYAKIGKKIAFIAGGETVVHVKGKGLGGRNQELVLAAAKPLDGLKGVCLLSIGSDGTDGPTDAAGAYADGKTLDQLKKKAFDYDRILADNNAYPALKAIDHLLFTGPTGTNVNDLTIALVDPGKE